MIRDPLVIALLIYIAALLTGIAFAAMYLLFTFAKDSQP